MARTQAQLVADMNSEFCVIPSNLVAYYRLNEGTAGGSNNGITSTVEDIANATGTLKNFALSGSASNWVTGSGITPGGPNFIKILHTHTAFAFSRHQSRFRGFTRIHEWPDRERPHRASPN